MVYSIKTLNTNMEKFSLFFERCLYPMEVLPKYKDDDNAFLSFTNIVHPTTNRPNLINKGGTKIGINPQSKYDTPIGVYFYPIKAYWNNLEEYNIHFAKEGPKLYVVKAKRPERLLYGSKYTEENFQRDKLELQEIFSKYDLDNIIDFEIDEDFLQYPAQKFWSLTRMLALKINLSRMNRGEKTSHPVVWTKIMNKFYDGVVDDEGKGFIHSNEPTQAVIWTKAQFNVVDFIDRKCAGSFYTWNREGKKFMLDKKDTISFGGYTLYRIKALKDINDVVKKGDLGGFVSSSKNLSQEGNCWIYEDAKVFGNAKVIGNAKVFGNALVFEYAEVSGNALVFGNAKVFGYAYVAGDAQVIGNAKVFGNAQVAGYAYVSGNAQVIGNAYVSGNAQVSGNAEVSGNALVSGNAEVSGDAYVFGNAYVSGIAKVIGYAKVSGDAPVIGYAKVFGNDKVAGDDMIKEKSMFYIIKESEDMAKKYNMFSKDYQAATGKSWDQNKFERRAANWKFYGDDNGYVAVRPQQSGFMKLVGTAGSNKSKYKGFKELMAENLPLWGMVDEKIYNMLKSFGLRGPNMIEKTALKMLLKSGKMNSVLGGAEILEINGDAVTLKYPDVGTVTKYFIGSPEYWSKVKKFWKK
jgi:carbonic anhydrase/acetyltransferase-like protein (isoleucine patch superfamily)